MLAVAENSSSAAAITVPNFSFETPDVSFAQSFDSTGGSPAPWQFTQSTAQQVGAFDNTDPTSPDHIDNVDGSQVAFMFVGPGISLFQTLTDPNSTFQSGKAYKFTIGAGGAPSLPNDAQLEISLYYMNGPTRVTISSTTFDFDPTLQPNNQYITHLFDFSVTTPVVQPADAWAGKNIGIEISTPGTPAFAYWDLDNARVDSVPEPASAALLFVGAAGAGIWRMRSRRSS